MPTGLGVSVRRLHPARRIDAIFADPSRSVLGYRVPDMPQTRVASDHFPLSADVALAAA
jgi:endonuclease/exonuclease/phosphatase family metal-dependent hydrolase